jgi:hypothetical protein
MTYYTDQINAYRKGIAEAMSGKRLRDSIRQLQERSKIRDSLKDLQARGPLVAKKKIGKRTANETGDFTEVSRLYYEATHELRSSDGLFVLEYQNVRRIVMDKATFTYLDYTEEE